MTTITAELPLTLTEQINFIESDSEQEELGIDLLQKAWKAHRSAWAYTGKVIIISRHSMNAMIRMCSLSQRILCPAVWVLKASAFVGLANSIVSLPSTVMNFGKNVRLGDVEGIALGALGLVMSGLDLFDDTTSVASFIAHFTGVTALGAFGFLGLPVIIALVGIGASTRSYKAACRAKFTWDLHRNLKTDDLKKLDGFLEKYLPTQTDAKTLAIREAQLQRRANPKIVELMKQLQTAQAQGTEGKDLSERTIKQLSCEENRLWKMLATNIAFIGFSTAMLAGFGLFYSSGLAPWVPFVVLAVAMTGRLGAQVYENFFLPQCDCV